MSAPVYRDPLFDGATDPVVVHNVATGEWHLFYTQRRATSALDEPGVAWVHGSSIVVAVSTDAGLTWQYRGVVENLDPPGSGHGPHTHWAPEVVYLDGNYHLFLSWIAGVPESWEGHARQIEHFVSPDLLHWTHSGRVPLASDRVIDAAVHQTADGLYRLWYKDEAAGSTTAVAVSADLAVWTAGGVVIAGEPHEGPNVFELGGWYWMIVDEWRGQRVHRSPDGLTWQAAGLILDAPGAHPLDRQVGRHADVHVQGDEAVVFYFTHPFWDGVELGDMGASVEARRSAVHVARLTVLDGALLCDRDVEPIPLRA